MPTSSNHSEVSVHCFHGKHTLASSRTLLSVLVEYSVDVSKCVKHTVHVYSSCSISSQLDWYSVFVNAGAEVASSFPPSSGAVIVPSSQQHQQTPPQPSIPLLSSPPATTTGKSPSWKHIELTHTAGDSELDTCRVKEEGTETDMPAL
jgi:hypothetical protein